MTPRARALTVCGLVPTLLTAVLCLARPAFLQRLEACDTGPMKW